MALKIEPTPTLYGEDAKQFLRRVRKLQNVPAKMISQEDVDKVIAAIHKIVPPVYTNEKNA